MQELEMYTKTLNNTAMQCILSNKNKLALAEGYILYDPSSFISINRLRDAIKVLVTYRYYAIKYLHRVYGLKVILPTNLYKILRNILEKHEIESIKIFKRWSPFTSKEDISKQIQNDEYIKTLKYFFDYFKPQSAYIHIQDVEKLGSESIFKKDVIKKLGQEIGHIIFDILAVSSKFRALLISFGNSTTNFIRRIGTTIFEGHSKFKQHIKRHTNTRKMLKFIIYTFSSDTIRQFIKDFELIDANIVADISRVGMLVIADG